METLEFYVVRSKDGKYLRSKGYGGLGKSWVDELKKAKVYTKKGPACAQVTWWATNFPDYGIPDLIPIIGTPGEPIPQEKRVLTSIWKKELSNTKRELAQAEADVKKAQRIVDDITNGRTERVLQILEEKYKGIADKLVNLQNEWPWM